MGTGIIPSNHSQRDHFILGRAQRDNLGGRCGTYSRQHNLKCVLNSLLVWTLNLDIDDPETSHIKCLMLVESCGVDRIAACDERVMCPHIHDLHVCSELYLGIGNGLTITIVNQHDH